MGDSANNQSPKKRDYPEGDERLELGLKRKKMRDLDSVFRSEERMEREAGQHRAVSADTAKNDLNANVHACNNAVDNDVLVCDKDTDKDPSFGNQEIDQHVESVKRRGFGLDLNAEDDSFHPDKNHEQFKFRDESECASSFGPLEEKDSMRVWKEMKQNGFLSSTHGGVPMPKPRGRKSKSDGIKKKMEIAKREQVDKFAKIAAPSGLLNGLNPGIINHVRNSKQVHSIIEALVRSEKVQHRNAGNRHGSQTKCGTSKESSERNSGVLSFSQEAGLQNTYAGGHQVSGYPESMNRSVSMSSELTGGDDESCTVETRAFGGIPHPLHFNPDCEDDVLALKLSSSTRIASENNSSATHEESAAVNSVTSLSVKAASVASQWLELLNQDIKGRLAALRRSKKRVRAVIHTELSYLVSKEFSSSQESSQSDTASVEAHRARWGALFHQMDKALSDEERQLESWWNQVKEMQLHCERGLFRYNAVNGVPLMDKLDPCRLEKTDEDLDRDLPVRAAAASIYSTCNFLATMENLPCC